MNDTVPLNQVNLKILVTCVEDNEPVDLSSVSAKQIKIWKPGGTLITGTASFETDGTDGQIYYPTVAGDLDEEGWYTFRAYVTDGAFIGHSSKGKFLVEALV